MHQSIEHRMAPALEPKRDGGVDGGAPMLANDREQDRKQSHEER